MNYKNLTPFKWCVIENFPFIEADFDAITNYQLFCKVVEYLNKTIDTTNILGKQVEIFSEYFKNLDVQNEIDNKLDNMAQTGELQNIIGEFLKLNSLLCFENVNEMKNSVNLIDGSYAKTLGFYNKNDGGNAFYKIRTITNEDIVDNASIIALNTNNLIAELIINESLNVKQFGAKGNGIDDDSEFFQKAINFCINKNYKLFADTSIFLINNTLLINTDNFIFKCLGTLKTTNASTIIELKGYYNDIYVKNMLSSNRQGIGFKSTGKLGFCNIKIEHINDFNIGISLDTSENKTGGILYNYIYNNLIIANKCLYLNANTSYINQNYFYLGELSGGTAIESEEITDERGEYNGNAFNNCGFENLQICLNLSNFTYNTFRDFRLFESISGDKFIILNNSGKNIFKSSATSAILQNTKIQDNTTRKLANIFECFLTQAGSVTSDYCTKALSYNNKFEVIENNSLSTRYSFGNNEIYVDNLNSLNAFNEISAYNSEQDTIIHLDEKYKYNNIYTQDFVLYISFIGGVYDLKVIDSENNEIFNLKDWTGTGQITVGGKALFGFKLYINKLYPYLIWKE